MRFPTFAVLAPGAMALGFLVSGGAAIAQGPAAEPGTAPQQQQQPPQIDPVSDKEIDLFIEAAGKVTELHETAQEQMAATQDEAQIEALNMETERNMRTEIERTGLSVDRYREIFVAYQSDQEGNQKVARKLEE